MATAEHLYDLPTPDPPDHFLDGVPPPRGESLTDQHLMQPHLALSRNHSYLSLNHPRLEDFPTPTLPPKPLLNRCQGFCQKAFPVLMILVPSLITGFVLGYIMGVLAMARSQPHQSTPGTSYMPFPANCRIFKPDETFGITFNFDNSTIRDATSDLVADAGLLATFSFTHLPGPGNTHFTRVESITLERAKSFAAEDVVVFQATLPRCVVPSIFVSASDLFWGLVGTTPPF